MGLIYTPLEVSAGMNMVNVIENALENQSSQAPAINLILDHILALERTVHH